MISVYYSGKAGREEVHHLHPGSGGNPPSPDNGGRGGKSLPPASGSPGSGGKSLSTAGAPGKGVNHRHSNRMEAKLVILNLQNRHREVVVDQIPSGEGASGKAGKSLVEGSLEGSGGSPSMALTGGRGFDSIDGKSGASSTTVSAGSGNEGKSELSLFSSVRGNSGKNHLRKVLL